MRKSPDLFSKIVFWLIGLTLFLGLFFSSVHGQDQTGERRIFSQVDLTDQIYNPTENEPNRIEVTKEAGLKFNQRLNEELKRQLLAVKNQRKRQKLEKIEREMNKLNQQIAARMLDHVLRMEKILNKTKTRINLMILDDFNLSDISQRVTTVDEIIRRTKESLMTQKEKIYLPRIKREKETRKKLTATYQELRADLENSNQDLLEIKKELIIILRILIKIQQGGI